MNQREQQDELIQRAQAAEDRSDLPEDIRSLLRRTGSEIMMLRAERDELKQRLNLAEGLLKEFAKTTRATAAMARSFL